MIDIRNPLIVALDLDSAEEALRLAENLRGEVGAFKVGPRLAIRYGRDLIERLADIAPVFVDNKYLDIPSTMEAAVRATFDAGASFATIHAWAGKEALIRLAAVEAELNRERPFQILVVTILTSFSEATLPPGLIPAPIEDHVLQLADLALSVGLTGLVCSPLELSAVRAEAKTAFLVAPGVRLENDGDDQKRTETPETAIALGASALVVGRPIYRAADPRLAVKQVLASIELGQKKLSRSR